MEIVFSLILIIFGFIQVAGRTKPDEKAPIQKDDLPYIACDVCDRVVEELFQIVSRLRSNTTPKKPLEEISIMESIDTICNPKNETGEWIRKVDIVQVDGSGTKAPYLQLAEGNGISKCGVECYTIAKSCEKLIDDDIDRDDLSSMLWSGKSTLAAAKDKVCKKWSGRCKSSPKTVPKSFTRVDYDFEAISEKDLEMEKLMESMKAMGLGGQMFHRDELQDQLMDGMMDDGMMDEDYLSAMGGMGGELDEEEDLEDDAKPGNMEF